MFEISLECVFETLFHLSVDLYFYIFIDHFSRGLFYLECQGDTSFGKRICFSNIKYVSNIEV